MGQNDRLGVPQAIPNWQRAEVKDALALLRLAANPDQVQSDEAFRRVCNVPARGLGPKALELLEGEAAQRQTSLLAAAETAPLAPKARAAATAFAAVIRAVAADRQATLADQLSLLLDRSGYRAMVRDSRAEAMEDRLENLQELLVLAGGFHSAQELLDHAALASAAPGEETAGRVQLMTLHKSKGLEFGNTFLPAWEVSTFPSLYGDADEERRLAYVALTRGMQRVAISHCEFRRGCTGPSGFITDIPDAHRVQGWLRAQGATRPPRVAVRFMDDLDDADLLRHF